MIQIFLICLVAIVASDCSTIHPNLSDLIPYMDPKYPIQTVGLKMMQCQNMYSNMTLMKLCYDRFGPEIDP